MSARDHAHTVIGATPSALRKVRASAAGLRHDAPDEKFAAAMLACEWGAPDCSYHGRCLQGGACFRPHPERAAARLIGGLARIEEAAGHCDIAAELGRAAAFLSSGADISDSEAA